MTSLRETMFQPQDFCLGETPWPARLGLFRDRGGDNGGPSAASQNQDSTDCSQGRTDQHTDFYFVDQVS